MTKTCLSRSWLDATGLLGIVACSAAASCATLIGIGDPKPYDSAAGGGTGVGGASATSAAGGSGGGMSSTTGGGGASPSCTPIGAPFTVLTIGDLLGDMLDTRFWVIPQTGPDAHWVHLMGRDLGTQALVVRTIHADGTVGDLVTWKLPDNTPVQPLGGHADASTLTAFVVTDQGLGQVEIPIDPQGVTSAPATFVPWTTPSGCIMNGYRGVNARWSGTEAQYIMSCLEAPASTKSTIYVGTSSASQVTTIATNVSVTDALANPAIYGFTGGMYYAFFEKADMTFEFGFGNAAAKIVNAHPFSYADAAHSATSVFGAVPTATGSALTVYGASVPLNGMNEAVWSGSTPFGKLATLEQSPPTGYLTLKTYPSISKVGPIFGAYDARSIVGAGPTDDQLGVAFSWLERDGTPLVLEQTVFTTTTATVLAGYAAPVDLVDKAVVWIEQKGSSRTVRAQMLSCIGASN